MGGEDAVCCEFAGEDEGEEDAEDMSGETVFETIGVEKAGEVVKGTGGNMDDETGIGG